MNFIKLVLISAFTILASSSVQAQLTTGTVDFDVDTLHSMEQVTVDLSDGSNLILVREYVVDHTQNSYSWVGSVQSDPISRAYITVNKPNAVGTIQTTYSLYELTITEAPTDPVKQIDPSTLPSEADPLDWPIFTDGFEKQSLEPLFKVQAVCDDTPASIDVMVLYTDDADNARGDIQAKIRQAITMANDSYLLSHIIPGEPNGIDLKLNLVHMQMVEVEEGSNAKLEKVVIDFQENGDGILDQVHILRDQFSADLSILIYESGDSCGIARSPEVREDSGFAIVRRRCVDDHTFTHEIGHLFGALHDKYVMPLPHSGSSYGYVHTETFTGWRTMMAYYDQCTDAPLVVWCPRPGFFSSPDYKDKHGNPTGVDGTDNRNQLISAANSVACYRDAPVVEPPAELILEGHTDIVNAIAFSSDASRLVSVSDDKTVRFWNPQSGAQIGANITQSSEVTSVTYFPGRDFVITGARSGELIYWGFDGSNLGSATFPRAVYSVFSDAERMLVGTGTTLLVIPPRPQVYVYDAAGGAALLTFGSEPSDAFYHSVVRSPTEDLILTAVAGVLTGSAKIWNGADGQLVRQLDIGRVVDAVFSHDGKYAVTTLGRKAKLWDIESVKIEANPVPIRVFDGHGQDVTAVAFSPDDAMVLTGSKDGIARLWQTDTKVLIRSFEGNGESVYSVAFSPDGNLVAIGSADGIIRISGIVPTLDLKLPLQGGKNWQLTAEAGGKNCPDGEPLLSSHIGLNYFSFDFNDVSQENGQETDVPVYAAASGTVVHASTEKDANNGYYVVIDHDGDGDVTTGYSTRYLHLATPPSPGYVTNGSDISQGDPIGILGETGYVLGGTHLHFGVRYGNEGYETVDQLRNVLLEGIPFEGYYVQCNGSTSIAYYPSTNTQ